MGSTGYTHVHTHTHTEAIVRLCPLTLATLVTLVMKFVYFLFCLPCAEGCSEMTSRLHSVKKTPDNNILIDTAEDSEHTVRTYLYSLSHTHIHFLLVLPLYLVQSFL